MWIPDPIEHFIPTDEFEDASRRPGKPPPSIFEGSRSARFPSKDLRHSSMHRLQASAAGVALESDLSGWVGGARHRPAAGTCLESDGRPQDRCGDQPRLPVHVRAEGARCVQLVLRVPRKRQQRPSARARSVLFRFSLHPVPPPGWRLWRLKTGRRRSKRKDASSVQYSGEREKPGARCRARTYC